MDILLIKEDKKITEKAIQTLEASGYTTTHCFDLKSAEYKILDMKYDIIILGINYKNGCGLEFAKKIRLNSKNRSSHLIFLTSEDRSDRILEAYENTQCYRYITYPFKSDKLLRTIRNIRHQYFHDVERFKFNHRQLVLDIPVDKIMYFESNNKKCYLHTENEAICLNRYPLKELLDRKELESFVQIHRGYIVNKNRIQGMMYNNKRWQCNIVGKNEHLDIGDKFVNHLSQTLREYVPQ